ncbi:hypothetical protein [Stenotrophomonas maltophilia]|uniref:hypothetical protein n=1 Tax=Stenotrophomonas maltophilia TaxID=40324 RepID=UPI001F46B644|nr:hypothetical protein [Stenotrophomonas maltophilia]MCF3470379.1 hypothetical protein [Stenotrophomonas maltophilia]
MDEELWKYGRQVADERKRSTSWELDFLRGMHQGPALTDLASALGQQTGQAVRLMSIWMDKHAWVSWKDSAGKLVAKRELADLAVIVRKPHGGGIARWMWLIQGKRTEKVLERYSGESSHYEIDLLQRMPEFSILGTNKKFDLRDEFPPRGRLASAADWRCDTGVPWTFMDFDACTHKASSAVAKGISPIAPRWLGAPAIAGTWADLWRRGHNAPDHSLSSYTKCLCAIINGGAAQWTTPGAPSGAVMEFTPGGPIDVEHFPVWSSLYGVLLNTAASATSQHARTELNEGASVLQVSKLVQDRDFFLSQYPEAFQFLMFNNYRIEGDESACAHIAYSGNFSAHAAACLHAFDRASLVDDSQVALNWTDVPVDLPPDAHLIGRDGGGMLTLFVDVVGESGLERG